MVVVVEEGLRWRVVVGEEAEVEVGAAKIEMLTNNVGGIVCCAM